MKNMEMLKNTRFIFINTFLEYLYLSDLFFLTST